LHFAHDHMIPSTRACDNGIVWRIRQHAVLMFPHAPFKIIRDSDVSTRDLLAMK
jgi:hypothetical protein